MTKARKMMISIVAVMIICISLLTVFACNYAGTGSAWYTGTVLYGNSLPCILFVHEDM